MSGVIWYTCISRYIITCLQPAPSVTTMGFVVSRLSLGESERFRVSFVYMTERKRKALSLKQKFDIIKAVESNPNKKRNAIAEEFKVLRTTLMNILREKAK